MAPLPAFELPDLEALVVGDGTYASPYRGLPSHEWAARTEQLLALHPLGGSELVQVIFGAWEDIMNASFGPWQVTKQVWPPASVLGSLLNNLIALRLMERYPEEWRREATAADKDLVNLRDTLFSVELKTSLQAGAGLYGNRSAAQPTTRSKKIKSGYLLGVNYETEHGPLSARR